MFEIAIRAKDGRILRRYPLPADRATVIGRGRDCDIQLAIATVSRRHAEILVDEEGLMYRDLGSTHGSYVSGRPVSRIRVTSGLEVQVGPARLLFEDIAAKIGAEIEAALDSDDDFFGGPDTPGSMDDTMI